MNEGWSSRGSEGMFSYLGDEQKQFSIAYLAQTMPVRHLNKVCDLFLQSPVSSADTHLLDQVMQ